MNSVRSVFNILQAPKLTVIQICTMKNFPPPPNYDFVEFPERTKLKTVDRVPQYPPGVRPPKMQKRLRYMRGPEEVHNFLVHRQYGIIATRGGRMRHCHFEMVRMSLLRKMDFDRMFAVWRVDPPWQPVTKKGQGMRMGGGKGAIDHYVTPIKAGRVIVELGGHFEYEEVRQVLLNIANKLPFRAIPVSQQIMDEMKAEEERIERENINPYTFKYIIQNNMGGCWNWLSPADFKWFGKHR